MTKTRSKYTVKEIPTTPTIDRLSLEVDGEIVATARPVANYAWRIDLADEYELRVDVPSQALARRVLAWLGEKIGEQSVDAVK